MAAGIGLDDFDPEQNDKLKGYQGAHRESVQAIKIFREAGIFPYANICLRKEFVRSGNLWNYLEFAKKLNLGVISLLEPKSCGRFLSEKGDDMFSEEDRAKVDYFFKEVNHSKKYKDYPLVAYMHYFERPEHLGCLMGGLSHFYINSLGHVQPCVFLPISFGNIMEEDFLNIYKRMKHEIPEPLHKPCPSIYFAETINAKKNQGMKLPIRYEDLENEWHELFA